MIQYFKLVLEKVSFDRYLFEKELKKALLTVVPTDFIELRNWCYENFSNKHVAILNRHFMEAPIM